MADELRRIEIIVNDRPIMVRERKPGDFNPDLENARVTLQAQFSAMARALNNTVYTSSRRDLTDPE